MPQVSLRATARRHLSRLAGAAALCANAGCGPAKILMDWHEPAFAGPPLGKVLVVALKQDAGRRRIWEDAFVSALAPAGTVATPSYRLFPAAVPDTAAIVATVRRERLDGVLVVHRVNTERVTRTIPGRTTYDPLSVIHDPFYGTYSTEYAVVNEPEEVATDRLVHDRTDVWELRGKGRLLYQGYTQSTNPESAADLAAQVSKLVVPRLREGHVFGTTRAYTNSE